MVDVVVFIHDFSILEPDGSPLAVDELDADGAVGIFSWGDEDSRQRVALFREVPA